jgi:hypothetical protein
MTSVEKCLRCGSPAVGNEFYCSNCGDRLALHGPGVGPPLRQPSRAVFWVLGTVALLGFLMIGGIWYVGHRVSNAVHARLGPDADAALGRVAKSLHTASAESHRDKDFGCALISQDDASALAGTRVTRTESQSDGCTYFGVPDPSLNPEADSIQEMVRASGGVDPKSANMIRQMTGAMRASVEQQDPGARPGPGGERPLFAIHASSALSLSMETAKRLNGSAMGGEVIPDLGDDAFFVTMHRMFFVRRGTDYLLIQPVFVKDKRAVSIAAARKILDSPRLHS